MNAATRFLVVVPVDGEGCELCRGAGLCPQCDGYGDLPGQAGRSGEACPLCAGEACCPQCAGVGAVDAVMS